MSRIAYLDCSPLMAELLGEAGELAAGIHVFHGDPSPAELAAFAAEAPVVLNGHTTMDAGTVAGLPRLRSIVFLGTGASSYIDVETCARLDIRVRTVRGYGDRTIAEHAFALLLAAARDIARMDRDLRAGAWSVREGVELAGRTLGVIGTGGVGAEMARIAAGFGLNVLAWNRSGVPAGLPAEAVDLVTLLARSDAVSLHLALTPQTHGFLDARRLACMKRGAILVNTARAGLVDEAALIAALRDGYLRHAAIDVFTTEPPPAGHALTLLPNVTLTAHAAWKSREASRRLLLGALALARADRDRLDAGQPLSA